MLPALKPPRPQIKAERRVSKGLTLLASFGHSKYISYTDSANSAVNTQNGLDFKADRSVSNYDIPNNFVLSAVYYLPFGQGGKFLTDNGWVSKYLLQGWQTTGILTLHTGFPFNITVPFDNANVGAEAERPTLVGQLRPPVFNQSLSEWFDTSALTIIPFTFGNLGRNAFRQDSLQNVDFGFFKQTAVTENNYFEFRTEFFNLFNTTFFGAPNASFGSPQFGHVLSAGNPRFVQFGLKFVF
jgi:hypothetical protein